MTIISYITAKFIIIIALVQILIKTTSSIDMTNGFNILLKPLAYLKIPTSIFALMLNLTFRFIPNMYQQAKQIMQAQKVKGIVNHKHKLIAKIKAYTQLIVPLFALAFETAENTSDALIIKGFRFQHKKHYYHHYKVGINDLIIGSISFAICILAYYMIAAHIFFAPFGIANSIIINSAQ